MIRYLWGNENHITTRELARGHFLKSAGAIGGVVLERHSNNSGENMI